MTTDEHRQMQQYIERGYELFTTRCAEGRGMSIEAIKKIAEGRVWDGATALEIGLVDELGDLDAAIEWVAQKAKLDKYKTSAYPKQKTARTRHARYGDVLVAARPLGAKPSSLGEAHCSTLYR